MSQLLLSELAESDLADICFTIAVDSIDTADKFVDSVKELMEKIAAQPSMGRSQPELGKETRSFVHGNYLVIYVPLTDGVGVARIVHGARDLQQVELPNFSP